jgi:hypothetical protein
MWRGLRLRYPEGFDQVLEQLMQAAGPQGPLPASDVVIEGLPRFKVDEKALGVPLLDPAQARAHGLQNKASSRIVPFARTILRSETKSCEYPARKPASA